MCATIPGYSRALESDFNLVPLRTFQLVEEKLTATSFLNTTSLCSKRPMDRDWSFFSNTFFRYRVREEKIGRTRPNFGQELLHRSSDANPSSSSTVCTSPSMRVVSKLVTFERRTDQSLFTQETSSPCECPVVQDPSEPWTLCLATASKQSRFIATRGAQWLTANKTDVKSESSWKNDLS